jgi:hypothetical protein
MWEYMPSLCSCLTPAQYGYYGTYNMSIYDAVRKRYPEDGKLETSWSYGLMWSFSVCVVIVA